MGRVQLAAGSWQRAGQQAIDELILLQVYLLHCLLYLVNIELSLQLQTHNYLVSNNNLYNFRLCNYPGIGLHYPGEIYL